MNPLTGLMKEEERLRYLVRSIWRHREDDFEGEIDAEEQMIKLFHASNLRVVERIRTIMENYRQASIWQITDDKSRKSCDEALTDLLASLQPKENKE